MRLTFAQLETLWQQAGGPPGSAATAAAVALAESGGDPTVLNDNAATGDYSVGLWQINYFGPLRAERTRQFGPPEGLVDPLANARAAVAVSGGGTNFGPWTTYTSGAYRRYLQAGPPAPAAPVGALPPNSRGKPGAPPKATLEVVNAPAPAGSVAAAKTDALETWNLLANQLFYWLPHGLNRSRRARAGMRALIR